MNTVKKETKEKAQEPKATQLTGVAAVRAKVKPKKKD